MELYKVAISKTKHGYLVKQPDFDLAIDADTINNAISAMKNQIEQEAVLKLKSGEILRNHQKTLNQNSNEYTVYIQTDIEKKFKESASESVRKNISMPAWMDIQLRYYGADASRLFQDAAIAYLEKMTNKKYREITTLDELKENVNEELLKEYAKECIKDILN